MWMHLAVAGSSDATRKTYTDARDELAKNMTPAQVADAQKRAREWSESFERRKP